MVHEVGPELGVAATCAAVGVARATYYRRRSPKQGPPRRRVPPRKLPPEERQQVLEVLHEPRFMDWAPTQVWAQLLDEQQYLCSPRTMHRILAENTESRERRNQLRHPQYEKPELIATKPNEVWSWDITKLLGPTTWTYYYLYVLLDIFSRYVVGWLVAEGESGAHAKGLIDESCERQGIEPGQLGIHSDRGPVMKGKRLAQLYADLGITRTLSRPHVSNDNPFSEAQFKTLKYRPEFPKRFGSPEHARGSAGDLLDWYNHEHHHSALGWLTPYDVHYGLAEQRLAARQTVLEAAYLAHPERFVHGPPTPPALARAVWINPPADKSIATRGADKDEAEPAGPAPSVLSPARRSGCSSAEPYPPSRRAEGTPALARCNAPNDDAALALARPHPDVPNALNLGGLGAAPPGGPALH
jgi:putative transposase